MNLASVSIIEHKVREAEIALEAIGFDLKLAAESRLQCASLGLRAATLPIAMAAANIAIDEQPLTLRGLFYRVVSAGLLPSTDGKHYAAFGRLMSTLRERGFVPFEWIVDGVRQTLKTSSWTGLADLPTLGIEVAPSWIGRSVADRKSRSRALASLEREGGIVRTARCRGSRLTHVQMSDRSIREIADACRPTAGDTAPMLTDLATGSEPLE